MPIPSPGAPFQVRAADLSCRDGLERLLDEVAPEAILHTAALAYPEKCEESPELAERLNACLPGWVASAAVRARIPLLHISTDAIFDGVRGGYAEDDLPNPRNLYARTKLAGERAVAEIDPQALIIRTVFYGWSLSGQRSLAEWFYTNLAAGNRVRGFTDAVFCPLIAGDLAGLLLEMLEHGPVRGISRRQPGAGHQVRFRGDDRPPVWPRRGADCPRLGGRQRAEGGALGQPVAALR